MSDYHILQGRPDGNYFTVVFHLPVPDTQNSAGFSYRQAIAAQVDPDWKSVVPHIDPAEEAAILAGELHEHAWGYDTHPGISLLAKRAELDAKFTSFSTAVIGQLEARFEFYGFDRDVS